MYADNQQKYVCVLNGKQPIHTLMNALGHVTLGLAGELTPDERALLDYPNEACGFQARISTFPFIILKAKNSNQLARLKEELSAAELSFNVFSNTMIGASADEQVSNTAAASPDNIDYWAVCAFGAADKLDPLTKRFSLFRAS